VSRAVLADENFPLPVIKGIRVAGHDVLAVAAVCPGLGDRVVLDLAREEERCLVTFDSDFGDIIFFHGVASPGAILFFRVQPVVIDDVLTAALRALTEVPDGFIAVVGRDDIRLRPFTPSATSD